MSLHNEDKSKQKVTAPRLRALKKEGHLISALTAYDVLTAKILDSSGVDIVLVGDSVGMVFGGLESTLPVTLEQILYHTKVVSRGVKRALLVADMPFLSYQISPEQAIENAGRLLKEANANAVKLEGGLHILGTVEKLIKIGIPVIGHLGLTPQSVNQFGGYGLRAESEEEADEIYQAALKLDKIGVSAIVLEKIPATLAKKITAAIEAPTIGIGAGKHCDGQILVSEDLLGIFDDFQPKFVRRYAHLAKDMKEAVKAYIEDVSSRNFPSEKESFK